VAVWKLSCFECGTRILRVIHGRDARATSTTTGSLMTIMRRLLSYTAFLLAFMATGSYPANVVAQDKPQPAATPASTCSRDTALDIIQRQIDLSKTIDDDVKNVIRPGPASS
jgi:hypothetical protein